jgi:hypothetical protein
MMTSAIPTTHAIFIHSISLARAFGIGFSLGFGFGHTRGIFFIVITSVRYSLQRLHLHVPRSHSAYSESRILIGALIRKFK